MHHRLALAALALLVSASGAACTSPVEEADATAAAQTSTDLDVLDAAALMRGLLAPPDSASRREAGEQLGARVAHMIRTQFARERRTDEGKITERVVGYTVEYLKTGARCSPEERVRVYRGTGRQNVVRASAEDTSGGVHVFKPMMSAMKKAFGGYVTDEEAFRRIQDPRTKIPMKVTTSARTAADMSARVAAVTNIGRDDPSIPPFEQHVDDVLPDLGLAYFFCYGRSRFDFNRETTTPVAFGFQELAFDHSQGAPWNVTKGSPFSPLLSTTLSATLPATKGWGPGFLAMDVCPERALFLQWPDYFEEQEAYVPLFVLPEEITTIISHPGDDDAARQDALARMDALSDTPKTRMTTAYARCLAGGDGASWAAGRQAFYAVVADDEKGKDVESFRANVRAALEAACPE